MEGGSEGGGGAEGMEGVRVDGGWEAGYYKGRYGAMEGITKVNITISAVSNI